MKKRIIYVVIIAMIVSMFQINTVKAESSNPVQKIVKIENGVLSGYEKMLQFAGMILDPALATPRIAANFVKQRLIALGLINNNATDEDVQRFFDDNITQSGDNITYSQYLNVYIKSEMQEIMNSQPWRYCYSYDIAQTTTEWSNGVIYNRIRDLVRDKQDQFYCMYTATRTDNNGYFYLWFIPKSDEVQFILGRDQGTWTECQGIANYYSWEWIINANVSTISANRYYFDGSTLVFDDYENIVISHIGLSDDPSMQSSFGRLNGAYSGVPTFITTNFNKDQIIVWDSLDAMKNGSVGNKGYYISDSYNTYQNTSGSYNTTTTDNSVNYGDVINYVNNYYNQNGEYPSQPVINIYIDNNKSGGGSGGGSGGSGGDSEDLGIFDFLSRIGQVLGNLIKNLGNVLAELVEGLAETVNSLFASIPQVFSAFMEGVFGWLPSELLALITLGISAMILVGIIKIFKG